MKKKVWIDAYTKKDGTPVQAHPATVNTTGLSLQDAVKPDIETLKADATLRAVHNRIDNHETSHRRPTDPETATGHAYGLSDMRDSPDTTRRAQYVMDITLDATNDMPDNELLGYLQGLSEGLNAYHHEPTLYPNGRTSAEQAEADTWNDNLDQEIRRYTKQASAVSIRPASPETDAELHTLNERILGLKTAWLSFPASETGSLQETKEIAAHNMLTHYRNPALTPEERRTGIRTVTAFWETQN